ncbi:hypothetical protein ACMU_16395 [Actibacterium mucosum KCTC 23349]|uniref:Short-chain dehydrogenase n=1 Tax=Actibacterium mucosum KCTC 23349 TaxID=1454373 RepID=A0A037ZDX2_9RHOB|nr:SDR family NAD(P)-dependent oxidoreductase [Actibacterium mucosum]KAJ54694.1 hypothetical protein ACMU_16395 [Actibacterium mucosum KCTC 23349]
MTEKPVAVIGGYGPGLGRGLATVFAEAGYQVVTLSRRGTAHPGALNIACDLTAAADVARSVAQVLQTYGRIDVYIHNVAALHIGPFLETSAETFDDLWQRAVMSAVHATQQVLPPMIDAQAGAILFSGATAAVRGGGRFGAFAATKFALRGLSQSLAREYQSQGVHVAHVILDGLMFGTPSVERFGGSEDTALLPEDVAMQYLNLTQQPRSCWTLELDLRPQSEGF